MSKRTFATILLFVLTLSVLPSANAQDDLIRVGVITSVTGTHADFGEAHTHGYALALKAINDAGGVLGRPLELVIEDDESTPEGAAAAVEMLVTEEDVSVIIGAYSSSATLAAIEVANEYEVPFLVPTAVSDAITEQGYEWIFRINAPSRAYAEAMLDFLAEVGEVEKLAVIHEDTAFGSGMAKATLAYAGEIGVEVVASEAYGSDLEDYQSLLLSVKDAEPDAIFFASYLEDAIMWMQEAEAVDLNVDAFTAAASGFALPDFIERAGPNAEFTLSVAQWTPDVAWPGASEFAALFAEAYEVEPQHHSTQAYAALFVVADAIERAGSADDPAAIRDALRETEIDTIFGPVAFDEGGQNTHPVLVTQVLQGEFVTVWPVEVATVEPVYPAPTWAERADFEYPETLGE